MLDGAYTDRTTARDPDRSEAESEQPVFPDHARLVREWTRALSNRPGWRGYLVRIALISGWH